MMPGLPFWRQRVIRKASAYPRTTSSTSAAMVLHRTNVDNTACRMRNVTSKKSSSGHSYARNMQSIQYRFCTSAIGRRDNASATAIPTDSLGSRRFLKSTSHSLESLPAIFSLPTLPIRTWWLCRHRKMSRLSSDGTIWVHSEVCIQRSSSPALNLCLHMRRLKLRSSAYTHTSIEPFLQSTTARYGLMPSWSNTCCANSNGRRMLIGLTSRLVAMYYVW